MTNNDKRELRQLVKNGCSFDMIRDIVDCCDATIVTYIRVFQTKKKDEN